MSAPTPEDVRHELLEPYLQRVAAFLRAHGDEARPLTIPLDPVPLALSAEERKAAWSVLCGPTADWSDPQAWIALGAGLHLAVSTVLESASHPQQVEQPDEVRQRLAATRDVAASYTEGLRQAIEEMVTSGQTDEAKRLSGFRNKLLEILTLLRGAGASTPPPVTQAAPADPQVDPPPGGDPAAPDNSPAPDPALRPYLQRAAAFLRARGHEERPLEISFGRRTLSLSAWERRVLWRSLCEGKEPASDWHRPIPECIAVQLTLLLSLDELERAGRSPEAERAARSSLQTALRLASGVVEGFRAQIGRLVNAGAVEDAKRLSALSGAFAATLLDARRALAKEPTGAVFTATADNGPDPSAGTSAPGLPSTVAATAPAEPPERLKPFLDRAAHLLEIRGHEDRPLSIPVGGRSWNLDAWERQVLWKVLCEEGPPPPNWSILLAHGAAAQFAGLLALERLRKAGAAPEARAVAEADRDAALQLASEVLERMQATSETLAADGQVKLAEQLARSREKLAELRQMLNRTR